MRVEFADGTFKLGWCPFCYQTTFGPYNIYNHETANPAPPPQPVLNSDLSLKVPAGYTSLPASAYSLPMLLDNPDIVVRSIWQGNPNAEINTNFAVKAIAPGGGPNTPCPQPTTGVAWQPSSDNPNPVANNLPTIPVGMTCDIQVVYSEQDPAGFPTIPTEQDMTNALNTPSQWGAPQVGYISCTNSGWANYTDSGAYCLFPFSDDELAPAVTPPGDEYYSQVAPMVLAQLSYGMTTPFGVLPAGMELATGSTLWSPDGTTALSFSGPTVPGGGNVSALMLSIGGTYPDTGMGNPTNAPAWAAPGGGSVTMLPNSPAVINSGELTMGGDGIATVNDSDGNPVWSSPAPATPPLGKPYLEVGPGGMWVQDAGNPGFPIWGTTPPQGPFELHEYDGSGPVPGQDPSQPASLGVGLQDEGCINPAALNVPPSPGQDPCAQFTYVTNMDGQAAPQGTGWLQIADGVCLNTPTEAEWTSGVSAVSPGPCTASNGNYWSFPGDGTIRAYSVYPQGGAGGPLLQCLSTGGNMFACPAPGEIPRGWTTFITLVSPGNSPP